MDIWGTDLNDIPGFTLTVADHLYRIVTYGMKDALSEVLK
jgi:hypothetical protein